MEAAYQRLTFSEHVGELRKRLAWSSAVFAIGGFAAYAYHSQIIQMLKRPLGGPLYYDTPAGNFNLIMEVSFMIGFAIAVPVLVFNIIRFVEPAIERRMRHRLVITLSLLSLVLAVAGAAFAYFIVLPISLHFFQGFKVAGISPLISAKNYLDFVVKCIAAFILIFQIPLGVLFANFVRPISPRTLLKYEKHVVIGSLIIALVLPFTYDPLTQFVIALPIIFLYNMSLLLVWIINKRAPKSVPTTPEPPDYQTTGDQTYMSQLANETSSQPAGPVSPPTVVHSGRIRARGVDGFHVARPRVQTAPRTHFYTKPTSRPSRGRYLDVAGNTNGLHITKPQVIRPKAPTNFLDLRPADTQESESV